MEAFPPGFDQLLSWENHTLWSPPSASRGTLRSERWRVKEERTHFDITLGSN